MISERLTGHSAKNGIKPANDNKNAGNMRRLDASDPRSLDHPSHRSQWFEIARAIGRQMSRDERNGRGGQHIGE